jgi:regulator of sirC expression with transglutaminase-like and TPR domain
LALSCLYIAAESNPGIDVPVYMGRISEYAERIRQKVHGRLSLFDSLYALNDLMFGELGFQGNSGNYYDLRNSLLNQVIDRKLGIPISLSILYMEIGNRIGVNLTGVNTSGHFLLSAGEGGSLVFIDPFRQGRIYSRWECLRLLNGSAIPPHDANKLDQLQRTYLPRAGNKMILARVLNNMKLVHTHAGEYGAAIADAERIHNLMPCNWRNIGDIAHLHARSGRARDAYHTLSRMVQMMPPHEDVSLQLDSLEMLKPLAEIDGFVDPEKIHEIPFFRI